jgi:hypothetical protein
MQTTDVVLWSYKNGIILAISQRFHELQVELTCVCVRVSISHRFHAPKLGIRL